MLLAVLVMLQTLWITHHLATECHVDATGGYTNGHVVARADAVTPACDEDRAPEQISEKQPHDPHCALDHKVEQDSRSQKTLMPTQATLWLSLADAGLPAIHCTGSASDISATVPPLATAINVFAAGPRAPPRA